MRRDKLLVTSRIICMSINNKAKYGKIISVVQWRRRTFLSQLGTTGHGPLQRIRAFHLQHASLVIYNIIRTRQTHNSTAFNNLVLLTAQQTPTSAPVLFLSADGGLTTAVAVTPRHEGKKPTTSSVERVRETTPSTSPLV